ncbi:hypothetical protein Acr_14g0003700 [Actinidia rufa]|uniref:Pectinesterase inhibitor domain-containing protein n=1 Tax=Actinidia rufa TaxID=165716 RepID=A0A7J0FPU1_9ERIC|nr:hypothetical protein Acr_14g0003700 [Actinidia rufa]
MRTFLSFSLLFLSLLAFSCSSGQTLIQDTCKACSEQDSNVNLTFCATSLEAAPDSGCASDLPGLGMISMGLVRRNVTSTRFNIKQLLKNKQLDPLCEAMLNRLSIMDASTTCEQGFQEKSGVISPLTKRNNDTFELSAMTLFMIHILQSG